MFSQIQKYDRSSEKRSEIEGELEDIQRSYVPWIQVTQILTIVIFKFSPGGELEGQPR